MKWLNFNNVRKSSFYITPNFPDSSTKSYKFSILRSSLYIFIYTIFAWLILIFIMSVTPLKDFIFVLDNKELNNQRERIIELQNKVEVLTNQLQSILSTNERMKYALKLAKKDSVKANDPIYDTLKTRIDKKLEIGGNIFITFQKLFFDFINQSKDKTNLVFQEPASGSIIQDFKPESGHFGIDFALKSGSPVFASAGGLIIFANFTIEDGYMIIIEHDNDFMSVYKHCSALLKKIRSVVKQGEIVALSGNSGQNTSGPHLHFEIWQKGKPINPKEIIIK